MIALSACTAGGGSDNETFQARNAARQACLSEVARQAGTSDVTMIKNYWSESGTTVIVGVGADQARWFCIGYENGTTGSTYPLSSLSGASR